MPAAFFNDDDDDNENAKYCFNN